MFILLSTAYLPPISYIKWLTQASPIEIEQHETYPKQTYRNRCYIYGPNGKQLLTVPVIKPNGNHTQTKDIIVDYTEAWNTQHIRSIETAYRNSPYFDYYQDAILTLIERKHTTLLDLNQSLLNTICKQLKIAPNLSLSNAYQKITDLNVTDLRTLIHPKTPTNIEFKRYIQTFEEKHGFISNLSILDLLFNLGPDAIHYLKGLK